jgi:hypothetical protein
MSAIRIRKKIDSETIHLPELKPFVGKTVEIIVQEDSVRPPATEKDWEEFFASAGPDLIDDPDLYKRHREFDRQHNVAPDL